MAMNKVYVNGVYELIKMELKSGVVGVNEFRLFPRKLNGAQILGDQTRGKNA